MSRRGREVAAGDAAGAADDGPETFARVSAPEGTASRLTAAPLDELGVVGLTRRRIAWLLAGLVATWIVIAFARQVGEASAASARADDIRAQNAALARDVDGLRRELATIQEEPFVRQQARANGLGPARERPFRLAPGAPPLPPNAPGSVATRLGSSSRQPSPLESWLSLLFGPDADRRRG